MVHFFQASNSQANPRYCPLSPPFSNGNSGDPHSYLCLFGWWCFTDSIMVNHHFAPPFGEYIWIYLELFPSTLRKSKSMGPPFPYYSLIPLPIQNPLVRMGMVWGPGVASLEKIPDFSQSQCFPVVIPTNAHLNNRGIRTQFIFLSLCITLVAMNTYPGIDFLLSWIVWYLENLVYHFFRQLWLVLGVKLMEINSNWFSR